MKHGNPDHLTVAPVVPLGILPAGTRFALPPAQRFGSCATVPAAFLILRRTGPAGLVTVVAQAASSEPSGLAGAVHHLMAETPVRPLTGYGGAQGASTEPRDRRETAEEDEYEAEREFMQTGGPSLAAELARDDALARGNRAGGRGH